MRFLTKEIYSSIASGKIDGSHANLMSEEYQKEFDKQNIDSEIPQQLIRLHDQEIEQLIMNEDRTMVLRFKDYGWGADQLELRGAKVLTMDCWPENLNWLYHELFRAKRNKNEYELHILLSGRKNRAFEANDLIVQCVEIAFKPNQK